MKKYLKILSVLFLVCSIVFFAWKPNIISANTNRENEIQKVTNDRGFTDIKNTNYNLMANEKSVSTPSIQTYANTTINSFPNISNDYTTPLDSKYSFFPRMNNSEEEKEKSKWFIEDTQAQITPVTAKTKGKELGDCDGKQIIKISDVKIPGKLRVTNVGMYNGKKIDLLVEVTYIRKEDYKPLFGQSIIAQFALGAAPDNFLDIYMSGDVKTEINLALTTVEHGTTNEIKTAGVVAYNNITKYKKLLLQKNQIETIYTPNSKENQLLYDGSSGDTIDNQKEVYTFQSTTTKDLEWNRLVQKYKDIARRTVGISMIERNSSVYQKLSTPPPLIVTPPLPTLSGKDTVTKPAESSLYTLYQVVPSQPSKALEQFDLAVALPAVFKDINPEDVTIKDQNGLVIANDKFKKVIETDGNGGQLIRIDATEAYLNSNLSDGSGLYSNVFEITIPVQLDFEKDYSAFVEDDPAGENEKSKLIKVNGAATLFSKDFGGLIGEVVQSELPVIFTNQSSLILDFRDENNEQIFQKSVLQTVGNQYDLTDAMNEVVDWGFSLVSVSDNVKGIQTPEDITVKIVLKDKRFDGNVDFYKDGQLIENNVLKYDDKITVSFNTIYKGAMEDTTFKNGQIITFYPKNVFKDKPSNMRLEDKDGHSIGEVVYEQPGDPAGRMEGKINANVPVGTEVYLKYDATVSRNLPVNSDYNFSFRLLTMDSVFDNQFLKDFSKNMTIKENMAPLIVNFLDEEGHPLHGSYTSEEIIGTPIDLTKVPKIADVLNKLKNDNYDLVKRPDSETITIVDGKNDFTYQFSGTLKIISAPQTLDFETKKATINAVKYTNPIISEPLVISDTRADKMKWSLKARVDQPLTHSDEVQGDIKIPDAIKYKYQDDELSLTDEDTVIFSHENTDSGSYDVTKERWSKGDGFMLDLAPGAIKALGKYQAQITIILENAK
ncbi:hypothetical protein IGJ02_000487 [Enterococcus sp. DIV0724b]|uniref:hypothetical protein n=1 Tax=Enterococcus sp. DIV0724b TaxID=2774694 RepID=UPI003D2FC171